MLAIIHPDNLDEEQAFTRAGQRLGSFQHLRCGAQHALAQRNIATAPVMDAVRPAEVRGGSHGFELAGLHRPAAEMDDSGDAATGARAWLCIPVLTRPFSGNSSAARRMSPA
jgi:hypothetical protein